MLYDVTYTPQQPTSPLMGGQRQPGRPGMETPTPMQHPDPSPDEPIEQVLNPQSNEDVLYGSLQETLADNIGYYVEIDFLIGTSNIVTRGGILYAVGVNYVTLYQDLEDRYVMCDLYSVKFVTFYNAKTTPRNRSNMSGMGNGNMGMNGSRSVG